MTFKNLVLYELVVATLLLARIGIPTEYSNSINQRYRSGIEVNDACQPLLVPSLLFLPALMNGKVAQYEGPWEMEPNNTVEQANGHLVSGRRYYGYPNDRNDLFSFYLTTAGHIEINLDHHTGDGVQLALLYQDLNRLVTYDYDLPYNIAYDGQPGLYYIFIFTENGYNVNNRYELITTFPTSQVVVNSSTRSWTNPFSTLTTSDWMGYRFEDGIQNWSTSEGSYKLAELTASEEYHCTGHQSLMLTTQISNVDTYLFTHTEATAYFDRAIPEGASSPGPYSLNKIPISCYVYFPTSWVANNGPLVDVQIYVKDNEFRNQWGTDIPITAELAEQWIKLELTVDATNAEPNFDVNNVNTLGIRIDATQNEPFDLVSSMYIDECSIEVP